MGIIGNILRGTVWQEIDPASYSVQLFGFKKQLCVLMCTWNLSFVVGLGKSRIRAFQTNHINEQLVKIRIRIEVHVLIAESQD